MSADAKTVALVPLADLVKLARLTRDMRRAQGKYFAARKGQPHADHTALLRASIDAERRCDAAVADVLDRGASLPGMEGGAL